MNCKIAVGFVIIIKSKWNWGIAISVVKPPVMTAWVDCAIPISGSPCEAVYLVIRKRTILDKNAAKCASDKILCLIK